MVSSFQSGKDGRKFDTQVEKILETKENQVIEGVIDGLRTPEECAKWINTEVEGQQRKEIIGYLNSKKMELEQ